MTEQNKENRLLNAKYVLGLARMLGCVMFLTKEDIAEHNKNMIFSLIASMKFRYEHGQAEKMHEMNLYKA